MCFIKSMFVLPWRMGRRLISVSDVLSPVQRGRYLVIRCPTDAEYNKWRRAMTSHTVDNIQARWVKPALTAPPHPKKVGHTHTCFS